MAARGEQQVEGGKVAEAVAGALKILTKNERQMRENNNFVTFLYEIYHQLYDSNRQHCRHVGCWPAGRWSCSIGKTGRKWLV